ncbi:MAG: type VI secretion system lipoprotein TssJ [Chromatiales bacterium]|nr:type VI secretion system lipoprotein TssJ [Chromatiales bacterium]
MRSTLRYLFLLIPLLLSACTTIKETIPFINTDGGGGPINMSLSVAASEDVNPDVEGVPSPIEIKIYQLSSSAKFESSDFFNLYNDEYLGSSLIETKIFILSPGETEEFKIDLDDGTQYIGVLAAFQDIDNAKWSDLLIVRDSRGILKKLLTSGQKMLLEVKVDKNSVILSEQRGYGADWL